MILGIGTDIVEIERVKKAVAKEAFVSRVFTEAEAAYCRSRGAGMAESFAGRFAAKEAVLKAFGTGLREGRMLDIEIVNDELGCPRLKLHGAFDKLAGRMGVSRAWLSISHAREYATAQCVLES